MNSYSLTTTPLVAGTIYEDNKRVEFDHFLFDDELAEVNDSIYQISYSRMTKYLESIPKDSLILFYFCFIDRIYLGVLDAFINFVPRVIDSLENAPEMTLSISRYHSLQRGNSDFGSYQHKYTKIKSTKDQNYYLGRTISRVDQTFADRNNVGQGFH
ncbi:hypothetical protein PAECIP111892_03614 [Paenibacillus auburnensis]|uniref:Uncharacterized protein n=1 Tax=Paenibacillus auburnensis TaxID=2905649 RepID=A0ABM9CHG4_9BACL|nr:hypothetical protein [Paenibacillus auburnensis]CAH1211644.1 hypothetical protein PAECIP111892_03614 [Paenibacillus auburnensis]